MINRPRLIQTFLDLVQIDSPSGHEAKIADILVAKLQSLGGDVEKDDYGNVIAKFDGEGEPILLNAHMDTVEPGREIKPIVQDKKIISGGDTILGADDKAGVAIILETLTSLKEDNTKHAPLDVVFTVEEELGLVGANNLAHEKLRAKYGIVFDGTENCENVTISAPGYERVDVKITGRGAHAGAEPEKGISAIQIAAAIISLLKLGRIDNETTANIGLIEGGSARNSIPETVAMYGEIRSRNLEKLEKHKLHFEQVFDKVRKQYPDAVIDVSLHREFNPYHFPEDHPTVEKISKILKKLGLKIRYDHAGGGTDVSIYHKYGIEAIAIGVGAYEEHTTREYIIIKQLLEGAKFCEAFVKRS